VRLDVFNSTTFSTEWLSETLKKITKRRIKKSIVIKRVIQKRNPINYQKVNNINISRLKTNKYKYRGKTIGIFNAGRMLDDMIYNYMIID